MNKHVARIKAVEAEGRTTVLVAWRGGGGAIIDLAGWIATGGDVLAPLRDEALFGAPRVAMHGAAVEWGEADADLAIDAHHLEQLAREQAPFGREEIAAWQEKLGLSNQEAKDFLGISLSTFNAYKAGSTVPQAIGMACRAAERDPILMQAHFRPRVAGRPRKRA